MNESIKARALDYAARCRDEQAELLRTLGRLPAPSRQEDLRAAFCRDWLQKQGAQDVTIDAAKNVICRLGPAECEDLVVFAAHTDVVFPDLDLLPVREEDGRLYAPGIGDDTANLVNLLLAARYLIARQVPLRCGVLIVANACGVLIVANACEEGLGNLDGTKALFAACGTRVRGYYSFDMYMPSCCTRAVGSWRYRITCRTAGGHSYQDFGKPSAIRLLCGLADELYRIVPPAGVTYNIGRIEGGTEGQGGRFEVELLGVRPGNGPLDKDAMDRFTAHTVDVIRAVTGQEPRMEAGSTDSNIPLSLGIPANTIGTVTGSLAHTRQEWVDLASLPTGLALALSLMLTYAEEV